jgi:hypothetical protein
MNWRVAVKVVVLLALMCAATWSVVTPKKSSPYASALNVVSVQKAWAACGTKCTGPHGVCTSGPLNAQCFTGGGHCITTDCQ